MPWWIFSNKPEKELIRLRRRIVELEGRLEKKDQFILGLARKFPEVAQELVKYKLGQRVEDIEKFMEAMLDS